MRRNKLLQKIKDEINYFNYINNECFYIEDKYDEYDDEYLINYDYLPKEKQIYKNGRLIDMMSFYSKEKIRSIKLDLILKEIK